MFLRKIGVAVLVIGGFAVASCDVLTEPPERTNPNDPKSPTFVPNGPSDLGITAEEGAVVLRWTDNSSFEGGYIVEKAIDDTSRYVQLATLAADAVSYRDTTGEVGLATYYRVSAFNQIGEELHRADSRSGLLNLGAVKSVALAKESGSSVRLTWTDDVRFEDGYLIEAAPEGSSDFAEVGSVPANTYAFVDGTTAFDFGQGLTYRVVPYLERSTGRQAISSGSATLDVRSLFAPSSVEFEFLDEQTVRVAWQPGSAFEHGFQLRRRGSYDDWRPVAFVETTPGETLPDSAGYGVRTYVDHFDADNYGHYEYSVAAVTGEAESVAAVSDQKQLVVTEPLISYQEGTDPSRVAFSWRHDDPMTSGYVVARASGRGVNLQYEEIARLPATARSYADTGVNASNEYSYYVSTLSGASTGVLSVGWMAGYDHVRRSEGHREPVRSISFSPDGTLFVTGTASGHLGEGADKDVILWDAANGALVRRLVGHTNNATSVNFSPDGSQVISASWLGTEVLVWDTQTGDLAFSIPEQAYEAEFSPDGSLIATIGGMGCTKLWDAETRELVHDYGCLGSPTTRPNSIAFSPDGKVLYSDGTYGFNGVRVLDVGTGEELRRIQVTTSFPFPISVSPDGAYLAAGTDLYADHGETVVFDAASGGHLFRMVGSPHAFAPGSDRIATVHGGYVVVTDLATGSLVGALHAFPAPTCVAFYPSGTRLVVGLEDGSVDVYELAGERWVTLP